MAAQFGQRLRRGAAATAVAAVAMAALTASQAPGLLIADRQTADGSAPAPDTPIDGDSPYYTDLPPLITPGKPGKPADLPSAIPQGPAGAGIPATVLDAYKKAEAALARSHPGCHLPWELLAAIGKVESGQARGGAVDAKGTTVKPILGPRLNGNGFANISDTDGGAYDGDATYDRAVGPMQFIPSTWANWSVDGNGDGRKDPNNVYDAALAAGRYLCADGRDLSVTADLHRAILGYNHSQEYLRTVLSWFEYYKKGTHEVPDGTGVLPAGTGRDGDGASDRPKDRKSTKKPGGSKAAEGSKSPTRSTERDSEGGGSSTKPHSTVSESGSISPVPSGNEGGDDSAGPSDPSTSPSECPTGTASSSPTTSPSASPSESTSPTPTASESTSPTPTASESTSPTPTASESATATPTGEPTDPCVSPDAGDSTPEPSPTTGTATGSAMASFL
jgi:hypothetical protein